MMKNDPISLIIEKMKKSDEHEEWWEDYTPFQNLMGIIISQRTNMRNGLNAFRGLLSKFKTLEDINDAEVSEIEQVIKCAGMAKAKAQTMKNVARYITEMYGGDLSKMLHKNYNDIRNELLEIKGIGCKTADVFLMVAVDAKVVPIDTHIHRILMRLGFIRNNASYEDARSILEKKIPPDERKIAHILLIKFGREICRATKPFCQICPVPRYCSYYKSVIK